MLAAFASFRSSLYRSAFRFDGDLMSHLAPFDNDLMSHLALLFDAEIRDIFVASVRFSTPKFVTFSLRRMLCFACLRCFSASFYLSFVMSRLRRLRFYA